MNSAALLIAALLTTVPPVSARTKVDWEELQKKGERALEKGAELREELHLGRDKERELGREVAAHLISRFGLYEDEDLTRYVNLVGGALVRKARRSDLSYRFGILNSRSVNAYAAPGGYVFITRGLLLRLRNEVQLAGVLAHEIIHVDDKHAIHGFIKGKALTALAGRLGKKRNFEKVTNALIEGIVDRGFSKGDEYSADKKALPLLADAGYHPAGLPAALKRLYGGKNSKRKASFDSRHPPLAKRRVRLNRQLKKYPNKGRINKRRFQRSVVFD